MKKIKKRSNKNQQYFVSLDPEDAEVIEQVAKTAGISKSALIRNMIKASMEDLKALKAVGVVDIVGLTRKGSERKAQEMKGDFQAVKA